MGTTQLQTYNNALMLCEERILASLTEARKPRYLLDQVWNSGGVIACLEEGLWTFAARADSITYDPNISPAFGYQHGFKKPDDYVRTIAISSDPYFNDALTQYEDENGYWWADCQTIFVRYVSKDAQYGSNLTIWPQSFQSFVEAHFASNIVKSLTHAKDIQDRVEMARKQTLKSARSKDAMNEPARFFPRGQLVRARQGSYFGRPDRSGRGSY